MNSSGIEWTDMTWNPVSGCSKVSQGCKNCYAERVFPRPYPGRAFTDVRTHPDRLDQPLRLRQGRRIFVNSMSDLFHEDVPFEFIADVFAVMACTTRHTYQVLTKRPNRMRDFFVWLAEDTVFDWPERIDPVRVWPQWKPANDKHGGYDNCGPVWPLQNVWLGVSVEDPPTAAERIRELLQTPAAVRFISAEPLLAAIHIKSYLLDNNLKLIENGKVPSGPDPAINWVIAGGETGLKARPTHPDWFRSLRDQCADAGTPFFFKQWGEWAPLHLHKTADSDLNIMKWPASAGRRHPNGPEINFERMARVGKKAAGRTLDGREHSDLPA